MYVLTKVIANRNDMANHISWTDSIRVQELVNSSGSGNIMFHTSKCDFFLTLHVLSSRSKAAVDVQAENLHLSERFPR